MSRDRSRRRHPSGLRLVQDADRVDSIVIARIEEGGAVRHYLFNHGPEDQHHHEPEDYLRWDITHHYDDEAEALVCYRTPLPVTTGPEAS